MADGNPEGQPGDHHRMECDDCREAISARLDGEAASLGTSDETVEEHLAACAACAAFADRASALHRLVRVRTADEVPDLTDAILAALPAGARPRPVREWARYALLAVALTQLVLALPALILGNDQGATVHVARELGSFDIALAVGLLWAAWQPRRASGLLPMAVALCGAIAASTVVDLLQGDAGAGAEAHHVLELAGLVLLYALSRPPTTASARRVGPTPVPA